MNRLNSPHFNYYFQELYDQLENYPDFKPFLLEHLGDIMEAIGDQLYFPPHIGFYEGKPILEFKDEDDQKLYRNFLQQGMMNSIRNPN